MDTDKDLIRCYFENLFDSYKIEADKEKLIRILEKHLDENYEIENEDENKEKVYAYVKEKFDKMFTKLFKERTENNYNISEINNFKVKLFQFKINII